MPARDALAPMAAPRASRGFSGPSPGAGHWSVATPPSSSGWPALTQLLVSLRANAPELARSPTFVLANTGADAAALTRHLATVERLATEPPRVHAFSDALRELSPDLALRLSGVYSGQYFGF